jgi:hypothetical protein
MAQAFGHSYGWLIRLTAQFCALPFDLPSLFHC